MTNEELIRIFFRGRIRGNEESYGFHISPNLDEPVGSMTLFSKTRPFPMAVRPSEYYFIIATPFAETNGRHCEAHNRLVITIAKQLKIRSVLSPRADRTYFRRYMEKKINENLSILANDLRTGSYMSVLRSTEADSLKPIFSSAREPDPYFVVPENYQKLMENIYALLEGERLLKLPKNQVALLDTDEVQSLWKWLIKESPIKKERELLLKVYTLSMFLASK